jgi:membrane protein DedA with SNARE-associated domain
MGVPSIFIGRFFGPLRGFGAARRRHFRNVLLAVQIVNFISALIWSAALLLVGDVMGKIAEWLFRAA